MKHVNMSITEINANTTIVEIEGEFDVYTSPQIIQQFISLIEGGTMFIITALTKTEYIDSTGFGTLISGLKKCRNIGGTMVLVNPIPSVVCILKVTRLYNELFKVFNTIEEAKAYIKSLAANSVAKKTPAPSE